MYRQITDLPDLLQHLTALSALIGAGCILYVIIHCIGIWVKGRKRKEIKVEHKHYEARFFGETDEWEIYSEKEN